MTCTCNTGPGKFEGESALAFLAYQHAGLADVTTGCTDWFRAPFNFDADSAAVEAARQYGYCEPCIEEALADESAGLSLVEDEVGFVWLEEFATIEAFEKALESAEEGDENEEVE